MQHIARCEAKEALISLLVVPAALPRPSLKLSLSQARVPRARMRVFSPSTEYQLCARLGRVKAIRFIGARDAAGFGRDVHARRKCRLASAFVALSRDEGRLSR